MRRIALLFLLGFITVPMSRATHIVGGDFYYKRISNNVYQVTLKLYIDCQNGSPEAISSDAIAIISVWDAKTSDLKDQMSFTRTGPTRLNKVNYKCLVPPQDVCVDEYVYTKTVNLNPGTDGIILAFQRCCRNNSISNLVHPESTGATYWVKIPGTNTTTNNSSAVFKELPPNYLCTDAPLKFDHSAVDPDGDSLVYELYQPFKGATDSKPRPDNTTTNGFFESPPFTTIQWLSPYYTQDQMSGDPIMKIDANTGELTVTPTVVGQFVIGIKVKEYRNGILVGETYRDYQMNVKKCTFNLVAAFAAPTYSCTDSVHFTNKSYSPSSNTTYRWDFGDTKTLADTSNETNPYYIYPGNGDYLVTLHVKNEICEDEYTFTVKVRSKVQFDLGPDMYFCDNVSAYLTARLFDATKVQWSNGKFGNTIQVNQPGKYYATVFYGSCFGSDTIELKMDPVNFSIPPDSIFCSLEDVDFIMDAGISGMKYRWSTSPKDTFQTLHVQDTGLYWVRVRNAHCVKTDSITIFLSTKPDIGSYFFVCNEFEKTLDAGDIPEAKYLWNDGSTGRFNTISSAGIHWVQVTQRHCVIRDTLLVENPIIDLELGNDTNYCDSLYRLMKAPPGMRQYLWYDGSNQQTSETRVPGKYYVWVEDTNGCEKSDTVFLTRTNSPVIDLGNDTSLCLLSVAKLGVNQKFSAYEWSTGSKEQYIQASDSGYYYLKVIDESGCTATDSVYISIDLNALPNILFIPNAFSPNGDGKNETFPYHEIIHQPEYRVRVYNRWGQLVFDSDTDPERQNWDATINGQRVALQAFMYLVDYRGCDGKKHHVSGTVTVLE